MISVVLPTVDGREKYLARAIRSLLEFAPEHSFEWLIYENEVSCSLAWNKGAERAEGEYILFFADDLEAHEGWAKVGIEWIEKGYLPAARILNSDGSLQSCGDDASEQETGTPTAVARIPFCSREQMECIFPVMENHYCGDYHFTHLGLECGWPSVVVRDFLFTHHLLDQGRLGGMHEDYAEFLRLTR